jgi:hypothetical protein
VSADVQNTDGTFHSAFEAQEEVRRVHESGLESLQHCYGPLTSDTWEICGGCVTRFESSCVLGDTTVTGPVAAFG